MLIYIKVKCTLVQALRLCTDRMAHRGSRGIALLFLDHGTRRWVRGQRHAQPHFTPGKSRYSLYRRLGWPQGRSGHVRKISLPPGFDPRIFQPVAIPTTLPGPLLCFPLVKLLVICCIQKRLRLHKLQRMYNRNWKQIT